MHTHTQFQCVPLSPLNLVSSSYWEVSSLNSNPPMSGGFLHTLPPALTKTVSPNSFTPWPPWPTTTRLSHVLRRTLTLMTNWVTRLSCKSCSTAIFDLYWPNMDNVAPPAISLPITFHHLPPLYTPSCHDCRIIVSWNWDSAGYVWYVCVVCGVWVRVHTSRTALIQPSFSGLFVTCAYFPKERNRKRITPWQPVYPGWHTYLPQTTFPLCVTRPNSLMFTWQQH